MIKRGQQDWDKQIAKHEISARPSLIFNTGTVHWTTNFENPVHHMTISGNAGYVVALTTTYAFTGATSLKITTNNVAGNNVLIEKETGLPETSKVGLECNISMPAVNGKYIIIGLRYFSGTVASVGYLRYDIQLEKWQYRTGAAAYTDVPDGAQKLYQYPSMFQHIKVIVDHTTHKYVRLYCNDKEWDLSELDMYTFAAAPGAFLDAVIDVTTNANAAVTYYLDDITITEETM